MKGHWEGRGIAPPLFTLGSRGGWVSTSHPNHFSSGKEPWYPLHRRVGRP